MGEAKDSFKETQAWLKKEINTQGDKCENADALKLGSFADAVGKMLESAKSKMPKPLARAMDQEFITGLTRGGNPPIGGRARPAAATGEGGISLTRWCCDHLRASSSRGSFHLLCVCFRCI